MSDFSPFDIEHDRLTAANLAALRTVTEGWYIEYKSEPTNPRAMGKSVSALANTLGGWLFYGVREQSRANPVAGAFPGVAEDQLHVILQQLQQAVAAHVNPPPHYDVKVLRGPEPAVELDAGRAVICVRVPRSTNTPHLHSSGVIYRRSGDGSDPVPETDRHQVELLLRRPKELKEDYRRWEEDLPDFTGVEAERPFMRLLMAPDLWRERDLWTDMGLTDARALLGSKEAPWAIPFDSVHSQPLGFVARQIEQNRPEDIGLTWWLRRDLRSEVIVPFNLYSGNLSEVRRALDCYEHGERFVRLLAAQGHREAHVIDINILFPAIGALIFTMDRLLTAACWSHSNWAKVQLLNISRAVPFLDSKRVIDDFEKAKVPVCLRDQMEVFPGHGPSGFVELPPYLEIEKPHHRAMQKACDIGELICSALGVAWPDDDAFIQELMQASERSRHRIGALATKA